jgi:cell wall-associated NlpC family hydrolase
MPEAEKWIGKRVFDCAGLVTAALSSFLGLKVISGASSQWKGDYWDLKGTIDTLPKDYVVILYRESPSSNPMRHTGIYTANGRFVDARGTKSGVVSGAIESYPWTHWALPKGMLSDTELNTLKAELSTQDSAQDKETGGGNMEIKAGSIA